MELLNRPSFQVGDMVRSRGSSTAFGPETIFKVIKVIPFNNGHKNTFKYELDFNYLRNTVIEENCLELLEREQR